MTSRLAACVLTLLIVPACNCGGVDGDIPDAGLPDAGPPDAGVPDAGPPCGIALDETTNATLYVTADDEASVFINGAFVASQAVPWSSNALNRTIRVNRNPTLPNVVSVLAWNRFSQGGVDRGMLLDFRLGDAGVASAPRIFASGAGWKVKVGGSTGIPEFADGGWTRLDFDDSSWDAGVAQIPYGSAPYGATFSRFGVTSTGASWMWAYDSAARAVGVKPMVEAVYFRQVFFFTVDGGFAADAGVCP